MKTITEILTELRELEIITFEDYKIVYEAYQNDNNDFTFEGSCGEYRVIADTEINEKIKDYFLSDYYCLDGNDEEIKANGEWFHIFRQN